MLTSKTTESWRETAWTFGLVDNTPPHLRAVVDAIEYKGVDAICRALGNKKVVQHLFCAARSPHIIKRMLETVESELGDTVFYQPLHHAARADRSEVIKVILAAGADPNRRNAYGKTPVDQGREARRICDEFNRNIPHQ